MSDVILSAYHGGLGDNLQFSTLPEEFFKQQGRETYIWSKANFRNSEIYELIWGHNPYVKGIKDGEWNAGDTPEIGHRNITGDCISNWEALHGLKPTNKYPKIYYQPKKIEQFSDSIIVDLSSISIAYDKNKIKKLYDTLKKEYDKIFYGIEFKNKINNQGSYNVYDVDVDGIIEIENIFAYVDIIYSSYGIISLHSGQSHLASAIKADYNPSLEIFALMDEDSYQHQNNKGIFIFDNVNYLRY